MWVYVWMGVHTCGGLGIILIAFPLGFFEASNPVLPDMVSLSSQLALEILVSDFPGLEL